MKIKNILLLSSITMTIAPIATVISCSNDNSKPKIQGIEGNIYASRTANIDNLVALGYQPKYVNKQFDGVTMPSYLKDFIKPNYTKKLHDRISADQTIDAENFVSKDIHSAFIAGFQGRLYNALKDAGLPKTNIGFSTMGETYVPDMDFRLNPENKKDYVLPSTFAGKQAGETVKGMLAVRARYNLEPKDKDTIDWGKARPTSSDTRQASNRTDLVFGPNSGTSNQITIQTGYDGETMTFDPAINEIDFANPDSYGYTNDVKVALDIIAENINRMSKTTEGATKKAGEIKTAFDNRVAALRSEANTSSKTALALKPNYSAQSIGEIIDTHFTWDPTIEPFFYSDTNGLGYNMPKFNPGHGTFKYLADDVDGLEIDNIPNLKASFEGQVDHLFFLKPAKFGFKDNDIKNELKSMTTSQDAKDVYVVSENQYYQANFGMMGQFTLMDQYAKDFNLTSFATGIDNWGWTPTKIEDLKTSL